MKIRIAWLVLSVLVAVALVFASCTPATQEPTEGETIEGEVVQQDQPDQPTDQPADGEEPAEDKGPEMVRNIHGNMVEKPQYGGTIRYRVFPSQAEHFDPLWWDANNMQSIITNKMMTADWSRGPQGSNEHPFNYSYYAEKWFEGELLESWEQFDLYRARFTLKKDIRFWSKPPVNGRELTVDDVIWSFLRGIITVRGSVGGFTAEESLSVWKEHTAGVEQGLIPRDWAEEYLAEAREVWKPTIDRVWPGAYEELRERYAESYALMEEKGYDVEDVPLLYSFIKKIDDYTYEFVDFDGEYNLWNSLTSSWIIPREVVEEFGDFDDWQTVVSTGAWIPTDYVRDSSVSFRRNPDYWQHDPNLPDNQLPYAYRLIALVILDQSTYLAALRTGKIDMGVAPWHKVEAFKENQPEMLNVQLLPTTSATIAVRTDIEPFSDIRVRHAAMLAMDQPSILNEFYEGNAKLWTWPLQEYFTEVWTPPGELPQDIKELYEYHPDRARELLEEAGYPNGFKTKYYIYPSADSQEIGQVAAEYLKAIGIEAEIVVPEAASFVSILYGGEVEHMIGLNWGNNFPTDAGMWAEGGETTSPYNFSQVDWPAAADLLETWSKTLDPAERNRMLKEHSIEEMRRAYNIILPVPVSSRFWWPWLKGYSGEMDLGYPDETGWGDIPKYLWIDQDLKFQMTGSRD